MKFIKESYNGNASPKELFFKYQFYLGIPVFILAAIYSTLYLFLKDNQAFSVISKLVLIPTILLFIHWGVKSFWRCAKNRKGISAFLCKSYATLFVPIFVILLILCSLTAPRFILERVNTMANTVFQVMPSEVVMMNVGKKINAKQYEEAIKILDLYIENNPPEAKLYEFRGSIKAQYMQEYDAALLDFSKSIEIDPASSTPYQLKAEAFTNQKKYPEALSAINKALELDTRSAKIYAQKTAILYSLGSKKEALESIEKAIGIEPDNKGFIEIKDILTSELQ